MKVPSNSELMHMRLQAWLKEYKCDDIEYLGERDGEHYYRISDNEVSVSNIEELEMVDD
jgi:hypothetical protein